MNRRLVLLTIATVNLWATATDRLRTLTDQLIRLGDKRGRTSTHTHTSAFRDDHRYADRSQKTIDRGSVNVVLFKSVIFSQFLGLRTKSRDWFVRPYGCFVYNIKSNLRCGISFVKQSNDPVYYDFNIRIDMLCFFHYNPNCLNIFPTGRFRCLQFISTRVDCFNMHDSRR